MGLAAFAHIDATGIIKRTSYDADGILIQEDGVMAALGSVHPESPVFQRRRCHFEFKKAATTVSTCGYKKNLLI